MQRIIRHIPVIIGKGRGQEAEGFYQERQRAEGRRQKEYCFLHSATTGGSKGLRPPPQSLIWWGSESPS
ncbi:hypothetical protein, partial [Nostoc linckia]|uniref:hypothetical protein n=2 Tax=Nostoc linckia TaxID=92942 RepID=UPI001C557D77